MMVLAHAVHNSVPGTYEGPRVHCSVCTELVVIWHYYGETDGWLATGAWQVLAAPSKQESYFLEFVHVHSAVLGHWYQVETATALTASARTGS